ncbi:hypothetical protein [Actinomadura rugatobispora]|uniref:Uncharacterized protein n=1 Tax=Actinomadura rugatobispora TaxID=1994 RepID=A0ABW0ZRP4_9ACTN|nr:hypothetical protein GCM10010200_051150 [Actinomadura rugatobispora]
MKKTLTICYGALAFVATLLAAVLAVVFLAALAVGGSAGAALSDLGATIADWSILVAAFAVLLGLISIYVSGEHALTTRGDRREPEPDDPSTT